VTTVPAGRPALRDEPAGGPGEAGTPARRPGGRQSGDRLPAWQAVAISMLLLALLVTGFVAYLFLASGLQEDSAQTRLYRQLAAELSQETGPLGPTRAGSPVAVVSIPAIGLRNAVIVEGTAPEMLELGPGHLRDTPLPGQLGLSVVYGRRTTFGAPFARLDELQPGDQIITTTQQGRAVYKVAAIGDSQHPVTDTALSRLVLLTASSRDIPAYYLEVDADLATAPHNGYVQLPPIGPAEAAMAGDTGALVLTMIWGLALAGVSAGGAAAAARWSGWPVYLVLAPAVLAVAWNFYQNLAALLPNLY